MVRNSPRQSKLVRALTRCGLLLLYSGVLSLIRRHRWWFLATTLAAVLLRLFFVLEMQLIAGDSTVYGEIARCLLNHHFFGLERETGWTPTLMRLPGYPFFLAFVFRLFGEDNYTAAMLLQLVFDVLTCFWIADITRRVFSPPLQANIGLAGDPGSERAAHTAFVLAAFCPFLVCYVATPLTECLEIFFIAGAVDAAIIAFDTDRLRWWAISGAACAGAILLRPDGGLILGGIGLPALWLISREPARRRRLIAGTLLLGVVALAPLVPWTLRNWRVFHVFQPLVTTHANDPGEYLPLGWERWLKTWIIDYANVQDVAFQVPGLPIDVGDIPDRAYDSSTQRALVRTLIEQYNVKYSMTPEMDRQFAALAEESIRSHPVRYYLLLPAARTADMWFRPRAEIFPLDVHFWQFREDPHDAWCSLGLMLLNLVYVGAALAAALQLGRRIRYLPMLLTYPVVRTLFLATTGASEDRYTLECFPFLIVLAAAWIAWREALSRKREAPQSSYDSK
jgi:hypothetical protein